jgi:O-acetyl-ADP-ribose deacetylase (regulator of RNase III)
MGLLINTTTVEVMIGDLAFQEVDALVHPTNNYLWFSSGVSESLKRRGGDDLEEKAMALAPIEVGQAAITNAGRLKCKSIIHAAAWGQDMRTNEKLIHRALAASFTVACGYKYQSVAVPVPCFSVHGFSMARAIETTFLSVVEHCMQPTSLTHIILIVNNKAEEDILISMLKSAKAGDPPKGKDD